MLQLISSGSYSVTGSCSNPKCTKSLRWIALKFRIVTTPAGINSIDLLTLQQQLNSTFEFRARGFSNRGRSFNNRFGSRGRFMRGNYNTTYSLSSPAYPSSSNWWNPSPHDYILDCWYGNVWYILIVYVCMINFMFSFLFKFFLFLNCSSIIISIFMPRPVSSLSMQLNFSFCFILALLMTIWSFCVFYYFFLWNNYFLSLSLDDYDFCMQSNAWLPSPPLFYPSLFPPLSPPMIFLWSAHK